MSTKKRPFSIDQSGQTSLTQQQFKDECDINSILKRFLKNGILDHLQPTQAQYGFAPSESFTESMFLVKQGEESFSQLPAAVRTHFENSPAAFLDAAADPERIDEFYDLGLLERPLPTELPVDTPTAPSDPVSPPAEPAVP